MPVNKFPVVHKFGIISHSQRVELQERLLKQSYLKSVERPRIAAGRNPLEITEEFSNKFNNAKTQDEVTKLEAKARKMLERIKRRAGLKAGGEGSHVDLPVAWTELAQLAQCRGKIQDECFTVLISSLERAPLRTQNIVALFFLSETTLYWLRTDIMGQPYLRVIEIKLLKMASLVFMRLFYHHMSGHLTAHGQFKNRLFQYLDGLDECQEAYNPYPNVLLSLRFVNEVGKIIISDASLDSTDISVDINVNFSEFDTQKPKKKDHIASAAVSTSVHDLSPTLWHALDVWRCTSGLGGGIADALKGLAHCAVGLSSESWIDACIAMSVLAEASKSNLQTLRVLQNFARGLIPQEAKPIASPDFSMQIPSMDTSSRENSPSKMLAEGKLSLSDIDERYEEELIGEQFIHDKNMTAVHEDLTALNLDDPVPVGEIPVEEDDTFEDGKDSVRVDKSSPHRRSKLDSRRKVTRESQRSKLSSVETLATGWKVDGSDFSRGRMSQASVITYSNEPTTGTVGINSWRWELAFFYTDALADICLNGGTSAIQKAALIGKNTNTDMLHKHVQDNCPMKSAGLLDLVFFHASQEASDGGPNDWSWRIRYAAIHNLVRICQCLSKDKNRDGLRTVAWNALLNVHSVEKDTRVLESFKVGQVDASIQELMSQYCALPTSTLASMIATGLVHAYLPPLPPIVTQRKSPSPAKPRVVLNHPVRTKNPQRTSLRQEVMLATTLQEPQIDFNTRTSFDLKRIVEDQWRKDLEVQLKKEEDDKEKELLSKMKEEKLQGQKPEEKRVRKSGSRLQPKPTYSVCNEADEDVVEINS